MLLDGLLACRRYYQYVGNPCRRRFLDKILGKAGFASMGSISFGTDFDIGSILVPSPAAGITAFLIFFMRRLPSLIQIFPFLHSFVFRILSCAALAYQKRPRSVVGTRLHRHYVTASCVGKALAVGYGDKVKIVGHEHRLSVTVNIQRTP